MKSKQYAVMNESFFPNLLFEGSRVEVWAWLKDNSELDAPGFTIVDRSTSIAVEEGEFMRQVDEEIMKAAKEKDRLAEERIRAIVREEMEKTMKAFERTMKAFEKTAGDLAHGLASYEVGELHRSTYSAIETLIQRVNEEQ